MSFFKSSPLLITIFLYSSITFAVENDSFHELSGGLGFYSGDALRSSFGGVASYAYHTNREYWLGADSWYFPINADDNSPVAARSGEKFFGVGGSLYINIPGLLSVTSLNHVGDGWKIDLYSSISSGLLLIDKYKEPYGAIGGGMLFHLPKNNFLLKADLKNLFYMLKNTGGSDFNSDTILSLQVGVGY